MAVEWNNLSKHYFTYDENGVEFFKSFEELMKSPARKEDMYVYLGELDEDNYDDDADDYRELNAIDYMFEWIGTIKKQNELCRSVVKNEYQPAMKQMDQKLTEFQKKAKKWDKLLQAIRKDHNIDISDADFDIWDYLGDKLHIDGGDDEDDEVDEVVKYDQDQVNEQISEYIFDVISGEGFDDEDFDELDFNFEEWVHNIKLAKEELKDFKENLEEEWDCHLGEFADTFDISSICAEITDRREEVDEVKEELRDVKEELDQWISSHDDDIREAIGSMKEEKEELEQQLLVWSTELYQYGKYPHEVYKSICEMLKGKVKLEKQVEKMKGQLQKIYKKYHKDKKEWLFESDVSFVQGYNYDGHDDAEYMWDFIQSNMPSDPKYQVKIFEEIYGSYDIKIIDGKVVDEE